MTPTSKRLGASLLAAMALQLSACSAPKPIGPITSTAPVASWVLDNVSIVDTRTGTFAPGLSVLIQNGRIAGISTAGDFASETRRVDGHSAWVAPGFNNMHEHTLQSDDVSGELKLMLAAGVTGFRQMAGSRDLLERRKAGDLLPGDAPALLSMPGQPLMSDVVQTPDQARAEVRRQKTDGADFIKVIDLPPQTLFAVLDEARRQGLTVAGHLSPATDPLEAAAHGMRVVEHLGPDTALSQECSSEHDRLRREAPAGSASPVAKLPGFLRRGLMNFMMSHDAILERFLANTALIKIKSDPEGVVRYSEVAGTFDPARCLTVATTLRDAGMWQSPTLTRIRTSAYGDDPGYARNPDLQYVSKASRKLWAQLAGKFTKTVTPQQRQGFKDLYAVDARMLKVLDDAGTPMLAGTDNGQWQVAGLDLHQEFDLLGAAGLSPLKILQMATLNPARFLGRERDMGTVEVGKSADLVLLGADPATSVAALHQIRGVVRGGRYLSRQDLDRLRQEVAAANR